MGVFLCLDIAPHRIKQKDWEKTYEESLMLAKEFGLLDIVSYTRNDYEIGMGAPTEERELFRKRRIGWHSIGDVISGDTTEDFVLYRDISSYYTGHDTDLDIDDGNDILTALLLDHEVPEDLKIHYERGIWDAKTQGSPSHYCLLAIGCLICSRHPDAAIVHGNITPAQCENAVEWANQYLISPISVPVTCDAEKLITRLYQAGFRGNFLMKALFRLALVPHDKKLGTAIRKYLSADEIKTYYKEKLNPLTDFTRSEFKSILREYLELGLDFNALCQIYVSDTDGCHMHPDMFISLLVKGKIHIEDKSTWDLTKGNPNDPHAESVTQQLNFAFWMMMGAGNQNVDAYIPLDTLKSICKNNFGNLCDVDMLFDLEIKNQEAKSENSVQKDLYDDPNGSLRQKLDQRIEEAGAPAKYDINEMEDMMEYVPAKTISPFMEKQLLFHFQTLHKFVDESWKNFQKLERKKRELYFQTKWNHYPLLMKSAWEFIWENVMDDEKIKPYYGMFLLNTDTMHAHTFCKYMWKHPELIQEYWDKAMTVPPIDISEKNEDS